MSILNNLDWEAEYGKMILGLRYTCPNYAKDEYTGRIKFHQHTSKDPKAAQHCMNLLVYGAKRKQDNVSRESLYEYGNRMHDNRASLGSVESLARWIMKNRTGEDYWDVKGHYTRLANGLRDSATRTKAKEYWAFCFDENGYEEIFNDFKNKAVDFLEVAVVQYEEWRKNLVMVSYVISRFAFPVKISEKEIDTVTYRIGKRRDVKKTFEMVGSVSLACAGIEKPFRGQISHLLGTMYKFGRADLDNDWDRVNYSGKGSRTEKEKKVWVEGVSDDLTVIRVRVIKQTYTKKYLKSHEIRYYVLFAYKGDLWKTEIPKTVDVMEMSKHKLTQLPNVEVYAQIGPDGDGNLD